MRLSGSRKMTDRNKVQSAPEKEAELMDLCANIRTEFSSVGPSNASGSDLRSPGES